LKTLEDDRAEALSSFALFGRRVHWDSSFDSDNSTSPDFTPDSDSTMMADFSATLDETFDADKTIANVDTGKLSFNKINLVLGLNSA
jgi:hypothetical protein